MKIKPVSLFSSKPFGSKPIKDVVLPQYVNCLLMLLYDFKQLTTKGLIRGLLPSQVSNIRLIIVPCINTTSADRYILELPTTLQDIYISITSRRVR